MAYNTTGTNGSLGNLGYQNTSPSTQLTDYPVEIRAQIYSQMIMEEIEDGFLPEGLTRDVSEFSDGARIVIPQLGEVTVTDVTETNAVAANALGTSEIALTIQKYRGSTLAISDELKQDSHMASAMEASFPRKMLKALKEDYEIDMLKQQAKQVAASTAWGSSAYGVSQTGLAAAATINGVPHRWVAGGTGGVFTIEDFIKAKFAMDKANLPAVNRIAIVDPAVEATFNKLVGNAAFSSNYHYEMLQETGWARDKQFLGNIFGFDIFVSNRLDTLGEESIGTFDDMYDGVLTSDVVTNGMKANMFMCMADEDTMPLMSAWRKMPSIEGERKADLRTDYFYSTARWGMGIQRPESMVVIGSSAINF